MINWKWKEGGKYLTRGGEVVVLKEIRDFDEWTYPISAESGEIYTKNGRFYDDISESEKDIVAEYVEEENIEQPEDQIVTIEIDGKTYTGSDGINWTLRTETPSVLSERTNKLYDLEQHIVSCSLVTEDIMTVLKMTDIREVTEDELFNVLNGIKTLYDMKFDLLQKAYEDVLKAGE